MRMRREPGLEEESAPETNREGNQPPVPTALRREKEVESLRAPSDSLDSNVVSLHEAVVKLLRGL